MTEPYFHSTVAHSFSIYLIIFGSLTDTFVSYFADFEDFAMFTVSTRGQLKLVHNNYDYNKSTVARRTQITTWRCATAHAHSYIKCKARAVTKEINGVPMVKSIGKHIHPTLSKEKIAKLQLKMGYDL